jgi:apolipoprotein N-acyltransferase
MALALPLVMPFVSIGEVDPAGRLEALAWVALVPAILSVRGAPSWVAALARGLVAGVAYAYIAVHWVAHAMSAVGGLKPAVGFLVLTLLVLAMASFWAAAFAISWKIRAELGWPLHVHLPVVWAALELARNYLLVSGFPWANLGYTQVRTARVAQMAALLGLYAIAALVVLVNAVVAEAIATRLEGRGIPRRALAVTAGLGVAVLAHGELRLRHLRERVAAARALKVGIVQPNIDQWTKNRAAGREQWILSRLVPLTVEADRAGADLVLWPETAFPRYVRPGTRSFKELEPGLPTLGRAHLLVGALEVEFIHGPRPGERLPRVRNGAILLSPALDVRGAARKHRLVPFGEYVPFQQVLRFVTPFVKIIAPMAPGRDLEVLEFTPASASAAAPTSASTSAALADSAARGRDPVRLGSMICFDNLFPELNVELARKEPDLIVNLTNDAWYGYSSGPYQSLAVTRMRAIEAGKAVVRAAYAGVSAVILPTGEVAPGALELGPVDQTHRLAEDAPPRLLIADVPLLRGRTVYTQFGDLFAWACAALTAVAFALAILRGRMARTRGVAG